ncbi:MAG: helix-turn-helix transcriptional regulator [Pseudomonadota bacterium]
MKTDRAGRSPDYLPVSDSQRTGAASGKALLSRDDIEWEYGLTRRFLEIAAHRGDGPPFIKISRRCVRYRRTDLEAWLAARTVE